MTLDYERRGVRLLTESDLDDLVDRVLLQEATIRQVEQKMRTQAAGLKHGIWGIILGWADTLRAILTAEQTEVTHE